jgi:hypothetical protein
VEYRGRLQVYKTPSSLNNLLVAQYDLTQLANDILVITGNQTAYNIFIRSLPKVLKNPEGLASLLLSAETPQGFLQTIALETNNFENYKKMAILGNDLPDEMNTIRSNIKPFPNVVTEQIYDPTINTNIPLWEETTLERKERNENRLTIVNTYRMVGLIGMYEQSAIDNYTTTEEIDNRRKILSQYYELLVENDESDYIIRNVKNDLDVVKTRTEQVLNTKEQQAYLVVTIKLERPYSAKMISYELYGELIKNETQLNTFAEVLIGLNRSQPAHAMTGEIKVIQVR